MKRAATSGICSAVPNRRHCFAAATVAIRGRWFPALVTTNTRNIGNPVPAACVLHTIVRDGNRVHVGISTGGHYLSEDGGETFQASNNGVGAGFVPDPYPEFGQCVHKIARHADAPGRLYMQNHGGWERSAGHRWCCAATTTAKRGTRSPTACRPISAFQLSCIRKTRTSFTSCRWSR